MRKANDDDERLLIEAKIARDSLKERVGDTKKKRRRPTSATMFLDVLLDHPHRGTFVWTDGPKSGERFSTAFHALAASIPRVSQMGYQHRADFIRSHAQTMKRGFAKSRSWLKRWFGNTIYYVPQDVPFGKQKVITIYPKHVLECGMEAAQMQTLYDRRRSVDVMDGTGFRHKAAGHKDKEVARLLISSSKESSRHVERHRPSKLEGRSD